MNKQKEHNLKLQFEYELEEFIKDRANRDG